MKLSILTIVKNDKKNLLISLKSVLSQSLKNIEYIVYDGMSNDGTKFIIRKYLNKNIKYISKKDKNYYQALNYAIKVSYLLNLYNMLPNAIQLSPSSRLAGKELQEQIKTLKNYVCLIKTY